MPPLLYRVLEIGNIPAERQSINRRSLETLGVLQVAEHCPPQAEVGTALAQHHPDSWSLWELYVPAVMCAARITVLLVWHGM